ncbi:MAG: RND efflux transporter [Rhodospirillaceae bacterium]|nr:MAG: RND efflux transporter [Rhodospirillaceae bacterium]
MLPSFTRLVIAHRVLVLLATLAVTGMAVYFSAGLRFVIDPAAILPQAHPFVAAKAMLEGVFGEKYAVVAAVARRDGGAADAALLEKVRRITDGLKALPRVTAATLLSVAGRNAKAITGDGDGFAVTPFRSALGEPEKLAKLLADNPVYQNAVVSGDGRMFAVAAQFDSDPLGYATVLDRVEPVIDRERDESVVIAVSGFVLFLGAIERYSARMVVFVPVAIVLIALVLFHAFRSVQGLALPLLTAVLTLVWVLGIMGASGMPLDVFNATTPILILAIAAGHAVQILKRYYEEYDRLLATTPLSPGEASIEAVVASVGQVGRYMVVASLVAAAGFLSLTVFEIKTVKVFGVFTGLGILSALVIELTFMPALRSLLKPPARQANTTGPWERVTGLLVRWAPTRRPFLVWAAVLAVAVAGAVQVWVENSTKANIADWTTLRTDDALINARMAGTQLLYVMIDTGADDGVKRPEVLAGIKAVQRALERDGDVGKTVSIADFLKRMNQAMHGPAFHVLPETAEQAGQYLLLYSMSGEPDDLKPYVDFTYRRANVKILVRRDDSAFVLGLVAAAQAAAKEALPGGRAGELCRRRGGGGGPARGAGARQASQHPPDHDGGVRGLQRGVPVAGGGGPGAGAAGGGGCRHLRASGLARHSAQHSDRPDFGDDGRHRRRLCHLFFVALSRGTGAQSRTGAGGDVALGGTGVSVRGDVGCGRLWGAGILVRLQGAPVAGAPDRRGDVRQRVRRAQPDPGPGGAPAAEVSVRRQGRRVTDAPQVDAVSCAAPGLSRPGGNAVADHGVERCRDQGGGLPG